jgi:hypothetical protein
MLFRTPEPGAAHALDAPVELVFDQPMDQSSVETAFEIEPAVTGELSWADARTLRFAPRTPFERGTQYQVTVGERARNVEGQSVPDPIRFSFQTLGYLEVSEVQPAPGSQGITPDASVTVVFNRPVVPLTSLDQQADLPQPLSFDPPVTGQGEWLNTAIYRFHPEEGFAPSTDYVGRVAAGLTDTTGNVLAKDYAWRFTTFGPNVRSWSPRSNAEHVAPGAVISVTFNQAMDHAATEAAFEITLNGQPVAGAFRWRSGEGRFPPETLGFVPADPLPRNGTVFVRVTDDARSRNGERTLPQDYSWNFYVVRDPGIVSVSPSDGATDVNPNTDVRITFASPMQREGLAAYLSILPEPTRVYSYWSEADTELRLVFPKEPQTSYNLTLDADAPDSYGALLGESLQLRFTTGDLPPYATLNTLSNVGSFNAYTDTLIYASARNVSYLNLRLHQLSPATFVRLHGAGSYEFRRDFVPDEEDLVRSWAVPLDLPANETRYVRLDMTDADGAQLPPGIYYLQMTAPELQARDPDRRPERYTFVRSRINLTLKHALQETLVWATDLASGQPVPDLALRFGRAREVMGATDADGLYQWADEGPENLWDDTFAFAEAPGDPNFAMAYSAWNDGIRPWNFDLPSDYDQDPYRAYLYTDRPIYRPDQTVYFKGIVRADDDADYSIPEAFDALQVRVNDPQGKELYSEELSISDMGTFHGELTLDAEAPLGTYYIQTGDRDLGFYASTSFRVAEYRKPEFQVAVETDRDAYLNGDDINVTVEASYYFGGPVANAQVRWSALSANYRFNYRCPAGQRCPRYSWTDYEWGRDRGESYGRYGRLIAEGEAVTDASGRATFQVAADIAEALNSQRFTLEARVTDLNNQVVSNRTGAIVHKGEFYVGLAPRGRIAQAGEEKVVDVLTVDWDSDPVEEVELDVIVMERRWYNVRQQAENGRYYWTWTVEETPVHTTTVTTGADGHAEAVFTPERSGSYRVRAIGEDGRGNEIRSSTYVWVWGGGAARWRRESTNRIDLITDKDAYEVGDVAEILVPSPYSGTVRALVTVERGHIIEAQVHEFESNTEVVRIPIEERHVPNVFVSVLIVQGSAQAPDVLATFKMGQVMLPVSTERKQLNIELTPGRPIESGEYYRPRETATYDVRVTDHTGEPVEAELSLRLADLAVLALADETGPTQLERFWSQRGLGVRTSLPLAVAMEPYNREIAPKAKGGGGGDGDGGFIRSRFADTAFWDPMVRTDADGRAQVEVQLPDNLTTWRMQARGITADTLVGRAEADVRSTLDLLVRPLLPRFFVVGDRAEIATIVHNNTDTTLTTDVSLTVEGLAVDGPTAQTVNISAQGETKLVWPVTVQDGQEVKVTMEAEADDYYDGREDTLPVYRYSTPEVVGTAGRLAEPGLRQEIVQLPREFDPTQGELTVQVDGSLVAATQDSLDYLKHYPYECVEQTVSRFLPNVLTYQMLEEMGLERPELRRALEDQVSVALQRLYARQHYDGGWGWWRADESNPYLTAYVLHGLLEAHRAGFTVDLEVVEKGATYLQSRLASPTQTMSHWQANRLAYQLYVLAEYIDLVPEAEDAGELGRAVKLYQYRHRLDRHGRATLAMALGMLDPTEGSRVETLLSNLAGEAIYSATGTHWEEERVDYWNMNTDVRTTAVVLWAMSQHMPESDLLPNVVRWLMSVREGDDMRRRYWESTYTTSWAMMSLIAYMRASGEMQGDYAYTVYLNNDVLLEGAFDEENLDEGRQAQVAIAELLADEMNHLVFQREPGGAGRSGEGQLYYTAHLRYFLPAAEVEARDRGIVVARQYSPADDPDAYVERAQVGDVLRVKLTIVAPTDLYYVVVEDPLPAGCEAVDMELKTTSVVGERPSIRNLTAEEQNYWYRWYGWGWWWFSHSEIRDEKVALFATYLPRGTYEYSYIMRASVPGEFNVIPTQAYEMYFPEVWGRSDGVKFVIQEN